MIFNACMNEEIGPVQVAALWTVTRHFLNFLKIINFCNLFLMICEVSFPKNLDTINNLNVNQRKCDCLHFQQ